MLTNQKPEVCCIFNYPPHYREKIYKLLEDEVNCTFFFGGSSEDGKIKKLDYTVFRKTISDLKTKKLISHFYWISGSVSLVFKSYKKFILTGEPYCVSAWIILLLGKLFGKKVYLWGHGWYGDETGVKRIIKYYFHKLASGIFLYGNYSRDLMIKEGFKPEKLHVVYNSLFYDEQIEIRKTLKQISIFKDHFNNENKNIIFIGRLTPVKKLDLLLHALKKIKDKGVNLNLTFIGNGTIKDDLISLTDNLELNNDVWFYGESYDEKELSELIYNADICVSPGNVGLTAIHVMTYGTPVITHDNFVNQMPEFEAVEDGVTGGFFKENDIDSLADKIIEWSNYSVQNRDAVRDACYKIIDTKFNPYNQVGKFKKVLLDE